MRGSRVFPVRRSSHTKAERRRNADRCGPEIERLIASAVSPKRPPPTRLAHAWPPVRAPHRKTPTPPSSWRTERHPATCSRNADRPLSSLTDIGSSQTELNTDRNRHHGIAAPRYTSSRYPSGTAVIPSTRCASKVPRHGSVGSNCRMLRHRHPASGCPLDRSSGTSESGRAVPNGTASDSEGTVVRSVSTTPMQRLLSVERTK